MNDWGIDAAGTPPVYVVLGATGGIGSTLSRRLAAAGARVTIAGRSESKLRALASEIGARSMVHDATRFKDVERVLEEAASWGGRLDGVANCVGSVLLKPAHLTTEQELADVITTNLGSAFATVRAAARAMRRSGGSIVLVSSSASRIGLANHEAIAAAKGGVASLTLAAAATYAATGLRVNAVAPGLVRTPATDRITSNETALATSISMHPLGRVGEPEDIASCIEWLLGPGSAWVTGQVIGVDGGLAAIKGRSAEAGSRSG